MARQLTYEVYGNKTASSIFVQPVDDHDLSEMDHQIKELRRLGHKEDYMIVTVKVPDWNRDLTPWKSAPVFGKIPFGDGAAAFLEDILALLEKEFKRDNVHYYLCGYSLAGLFALWSAYQTDFFSGVGAASASLWYKDWLSYAAKQTIQTSAVYLSLGTKEEKARNQIMATIGDCMREMDQLLEKQSIHHILEWNPGNHFVDNGIRVGKAMAWLLDQNHEKSSVKN